MFNFILKQILYFLIITKKAVRKSLLTKNEQMQSMIEQCIHNQLKFECILADSWFSSMYNMHFIAPKKEVFRF